ncbi:MAG TPA: hypothetical protein VFB14_04800 [Bryobacteraceae bacterium]|jgi:uncharacterized protein (DUF697 family)|nr:hypothetical protein [Bryobacteraceae bacterium]
MSSYSNPLTEYSPQMEGFEYSEFDFAGSAPGPFSAHEEMELAAELLDAANEQELDQFLGDLISKAGKAISNFAHSSVGQAIGGVLKKAAKVALPIAGGALGTFLGGPVGSAIGSSLANVAGNALGLELEGLSPEDREFEAARQFIRFAGQAAKNAADAPAGGDPQATAHKAALDAARIYAPGLIDNAQAGLSAGSPRGRQGRWIRHQGKIVLFGV